MAYKEGKYRSVANNIRFLNDNETLYIKNNFVIRGSIEGIFNHNKTKSFYLKAKPLFNLYDTSELLGIE